MRDRIRKRLTEYQAEALDSITVAVSKTKAIAARDGISGAMYLSICEHNKTAFATYLDNSASFIHHVAGPSALEYADELRDAANELKHEIIVKLDRDNFTGDSVFITPALQSIRYQLRNDLEAALGKLVERKLEDFELGIIGGKDMNVTTHNTVNIINSNISNAVVQITQSGKDAISKDTAQKLEQIINSEEIKGLPEETRLDVLDQVDNVTKELNAPTTDAGKVHRALKRLGNFISSVASKALTDTVAQLAVAYAKAHGM
jgi:hypothetical protein